LVNHLILHSNQGFYYIIEIRILIKQNQKNNQKAKEGRISRGATEDKINREVFWLQTKN